MILITGAAGYIGSHVAKQLLETNKDIIVLDNLSTGSIKTIETLQKIKPFKFIELDLKEFDKVNSFIKENQIDTIIHFAASIIVPESMENPIKYYMNNTVNTTNLIKCAIVNGVKKFIFSSTAAVYGESKTIPDSGISESNETKPINPYGMSKLMSERVLQDSAKAHNDFKYVIFRYFNVAGADINYKDNKLSPRIGQNSLKATHLIKIASECASNTRDKMYIFGNNYPTEDGTCIRDYIHVDDLALAHIKAIDYLDSNKSDIFNLGYGTGLSVKSVIETVKKITNNDFLVENAPRRIGDPAILIANNHKFLNIFGNIFKYQDLDIICKSAYEWEKLKF
jgi:UDP-glucose 4-epimerase